jgi:hypothetical protein
MRVVLVVTWLAMSCAGLGEEKDERSPADQYRAGAPGEVVEIKLDETGRVSGPNLALVTTDKGYRGAVAGAPVDLEWDGNRIVGTLGGEPVSLLVTNEGNMVRASGDFAGMLGVLELGSTTLRSWIARSQYELQNISDRRWKGKRANTDLTELRPVEVDLPRDFRRLPHNRQLMVLALLLGR